MIRIVRTARVRAVERQLADTRARLAEAREAADRALARHLADQLAAGARQHAAEARAGWETFRADVAESTARRLHEEITKLLNEPQTPGHPAYDEPGEAR
ncbi:hypothetical protein [Streptomyces sp. NPDC049881]|uniref:hypothetical protein n=1 Tax=Streptomyces sp. NPDC049881 TaxID=3155778 RepID=UPI0034190768